MSFLLILFLAKLLKKYLLVRLFILYTGDVFLINFIILVIKIYINFCSMYCFNAQLIISSWKLRNINY